MIVFLTVLYCVLLVLLVKLRIVKFTLFWKLSPALWMISLLVILFIPMQWGAPQGNLLTYRLSMEVNPLLNDSGEVTEVFVEPGQRIEKGDVLFKLDPTPIKNKLAALNAQLTLAETRLKQAKELQEAEAGSVYDVESYQAQVDQLNANIANSEYDLEKTSVLAPQGGTMSAFTLKEGQKASFLMTRAEGVIALDERRFVLWMPQYTLRYVEVDAPVEVTLQMFPGQIFSGKVKNIAPLVGKGTYSYYVTAPNPPANFYGSPIPIVVELDNLPAELEGAIPGGASGIGVVYTKEMKPTQLIRKVMIRMTAWMNYVRPS